MDNRDNEMIKAMAFIKEYCNELDECKNCPMYDNCSGLFHKRYPYYWYIPEV